MIAVHDLAYHEYEGIATDLGERERILGRHCLENSTALIRRIEIRQ
jgi:hypothetical protein